MNAKLADVNINDFRIVTISEEMPNKQESSPSKFKVNTPDNKVRMSFE